MYACASRAMTHLQRRELRRLMRSSVSGPSGSPDRFFSPVRLPRALLLLPQRQQSPVDFEWRSGFGGVVWEPAYSMASPEPWKPST